MSEITQEQTLHALRRVIVVEDIADTSPAHHRGYQDHEREGHGSTEQNASRAPGYRHSPSAFHITIELDTAKGRYEGVLQRYHKDQTPPHRPDDHYTPQGTPRSPAIRHVQVNLTEILAYRVLKVEVADGS